MTSPEREPSDTRAGLPGQGGSEPAIPDERLESAPVSGEVFAEEPPAQREWWDDPSLPWRHKPTKADLWCWGAIALVGIYNLVLLPLRPVLLLNPYLVGMLTGGWSGVTLMGAETAVHGGPWLLGWFVATLSILKFDWIYWWAGKLWGHGLIEIIAGRSARSRRGVERALKVTRRFETIAIFLTYLPLPLPNAVIYIALGAEGMRLRKFLLVDAIAAAIAQAGFMYLGYSIGAPAVAAVTLYARYLWYVSLAILVGMIVVWWVRRPQSASAAK